MSVPPFDFAQGGKLQVPGPEGLDFQAAFQGPEGPCSLRNCSLRLRQARTWRFLLPTELGSATRLSAGGDLVALGFFVHFGGVAGAFTEAAIAALAASHGFTVESDFANGVALLRRRLP